MCPRRDWITTPASTAGRLFEVPVDRQARRRVYLHRLREKSEFFAFEAIYSLTRAGPSELCSGRFKRFEFFERLELLIWVGPSPEGRAAFIETR